MIYIVRFPGGWFKLGHTSTDIWTRASQFWTNSHPTELCGKLGAENVSVEALFTGSFAEEQALFAIFKPQRGEFFDESQQSLQELLSLVELMLERLPTPTKPTNFPGAQEKLPCCGGTEYECFQCGARFPRGIKLKQHLDDIHRKKRASCGFCNLQVIPRNLKRHQDNCKKR